MKLHLGCGPRKIHGFVNIDALGSVFPDLVEDVFSLPSFRPNTVDLIYACHVLEHAERNTYKRVLNRWFELLKPNHELRLATPDLRAAMEWYLDTGRLRDIHGLLYGGQKDGYDHHGWGWDEQTLTADLQEAGFVHVARYDWRETDHFYIDDYSAAYLPAIAYKTRRGPSPIMQGKLVSLNLCAFKP